MLTSRIAPALGLASLLLLAACQETAQQQSTAVNDSAALALDTGMTAPDTAAGMNGTPAGTAAGTTSAGIDTTGPGPATIPPNRYTTTASGLKYYDLQQGSGASPQPADRVRVHYTGWLRSDSTKFDSSYDRGTPATFPLNGVIKGWTEGLQSMQVGGRRQLVVPADLAYGQRQRGPIPPGATLIFDVKLLGIEGQPGAGASN